MADETINTKMCGICREVKAFGQFNKNKTMKYGLRFECKECRKTNRKRERKVIPHGFKKCGCCEKILEERYFNYDKHTKTGLASYCKICSSNKIKIRYRKKHGLKIKEKLQEGFKRCYRCKVVMNKIFFWQR